MAELVFNNTNTPIHFRRTLIRSVPCCNEDAETICRVTGQRYDVEAGIYGVDFMDQDTVYLCGEQGSYEMKHTAPPSAEIQKIELVTPEWSYFGKELWFESEDVHMDIFNSYESFDTNPADRKLVYSTREDCIIIHEGREVYELQISTDSNIPYVEVEQMSIRNIRRYRLDDKNYEEGMFFICFGELYYQDGVDESARTYHISSYMNTPVTMHEGEQTKMQYGYCHAASVSAENINIYSVERV